MTCLRVSLRQLRTVSETLLITFLDRQHIRQFSLDLINTGNTPDSRSCSSYPKISSSRLYILDVMAGVGKGFVAIWIPVD